MIATSYHISEVEFGNYFYLTTDGETFFRGCKRCGGTGNYSYNGEHSRCYACNNEFSARLGALVGDRAAAEKDAKARQARVDARIRKENARVERLVRIRDEKVAALRKIDNDVVEFLLAIDLQEPDRNLTAFVAAMAENLQYPAQAERPFTERMLEATRKIVAKTAERKAEQDAHPAPSGRVVVTGEVVSAKVVESEYGATVKLLVKDDAGFKVYVSLPSSLRDAAFDDDDMYDMDGLKGRRITLTAGLEPSKDDKSFAFGSRPTKAAWL